MNMNRTEKTSFYRIICVLLVLTLLGTPAAGLLSGDFLSVYVVEFSHLEMGMIMSLYSQWRRVFSMMRNYLEWYLDPKQRTGKITPSYLNLGFDKIPDVFAPQELLEFLRRILPSYE